MIRLAVVDDFPMNVLGFEQTFVAAPDVRVVAGVTDPDDLPAGDAFDVVLCDLYLDGGQQPSLDVIERLAARAHVLVVSRSGRPLDVRSALARGARGYLTKRAPLAEFLPAVRTVAAGDVYLTGELADLLAAAENTDPRLSPRELEVVELIASGLANKQIAARLSIDTSTVDTYIDRVKRKLGVRGNRVVLALEALRHQYPDFPPSDVR
ncbi:response regulator transcription factor [Longispora sp. NPDC051575]|uniref:response regulator transcription factor n=1 Tax=Longispora sp. NPDC051575 TaxID=3154943 RepID=UPI00343AB86B